MLKKTEKMIDAHCHLASLKATPIKFLEGISHNIELQSKATGIPVGREDILNYLISQQDDDDGDHLREIQEEAGVSTVILLAPDFSYVFDLDMSYQEVIEHHINVCENHGGFYKLFAGVDPRWGKDGVDYFREIVESGKACGLKLYPPCGYSPSDYACFPLYEICEEYHLPVLYHSGPTSPALSFKYCNPFDIDEAACRYKNVNFIAAHAAINQWSDSILLAKYRPNIYLDISGFLGYTGDVEWDKHLNRIFNCGINHKIIYGTDWPVFRNNESVKTSIEKKFISGNGTVSQVDSENIMHGNISRICHFQ